MFLPLTLKETLIFSMMLQLKFDMLIFIHVILYLIFDKFSWHNYKNKFLPLTLKETLIFSMMLQLQV